MARRAALENKKKGQHKKETSPNKPGDKDKEDVFKIASTDLDALKLKEAIVDVKDFEYITYSLDLEWIVDLAIMSIFSFIVTETIFYFCPKTNESNFSILWALLVIVYCVYVLFLLTAVYFKSNLSIGERSICIISASIFLIASMVLLVADENNLEFELESAYRSFNETATAFVNNKTLSPILIDKQNRGQLKPISFLLVKFVIAIVCSFIGAVFTFPGLRFGQLQKGLMESTELSALSRTFCVINYLSPLLVVLLWIKPISRDLLTEQDILPIDDNTFNTLRIYSIILLNLFRFYQLPKYVAMFLRGAKRRITRFKWRGGTATNKEIQLSISSIYNFVNVVTLQYLLPILMCLFTAFMYTTMGGYSWIPFNTPSANNDTLIREFGLPYNEYKATGNDVPLTMEELEQLEDIMVNGNGTLASGATEDFIVKAHVINVSEIRKIFSPQVFRGIFGFATWWLHFTWFCTTTVGFVYHTCFIH